MRLQSEALDDDQRKSFMDRINPKYILRNHLAQAGIEKAQQDDFSEVATLLEILSKPYDEQIECESYSQAPPIDMQAVAVSCSS